MPRVPQAYETGAQRGAHPPAGQIPGGQRVERDGAAGTVTGTADASASAGAGGTDGGPSRHLVGRLGRFALAVYPPAVFLPFMFLWAAGLTGLVAASGGLAHRWSLNTGVGITAATVFVDMFLMRALDDVRDLDYDRTHFPRRPLPSGMVKVRDLVAAVAIGTAALLLLNGGRGVALIVLAAQLGYAIGLVTVNILGWPASENMLLQFVLNSPIQILLLLYVYAVFLRTEHQSPGSRGLLATAAVLLTMVYFEFARKITRTPATAERTYVRFIGLGGTVVAAVAAALLTAGLAIAATRPWAPGSPAYGWGWLALAPLAVPIAAGWGFWRNGLTRWPLMGALGFPLAAFTAFLLIGLLGSGPAL